jgi:Ion channel
LIIASLFATALSDSTVAEIVAVVLQGGTLLFALHTSRARPSVQRAAVVLFVLMPIAPVLASSAESDAVLAIGSAVRLLLALAALGAILRRLTEHLTVNGETLMGALSMYLLLGLVFAAAFGLIGAVESGPFFTGLSDGTWADRLYFSFTTMATVGYGDLTASSDLGRMCAISEALIGQLYLVSVVALIVSNLGRTRRPRDTGA